ncbi:hypothetical protein DB346_24290 [Verrucomicrobia bacterium LW23]|nr:hypothetical protein DB346_24290 [Verrucomicrobia bacterium LW23]
MAITRGVKHGAPQRIVIYAPQGFGKTTLATWFPAPVIIDAEDGSGQLDVARVEVKCWLDIERGIAEAIAAREFRTLVLDTIDWVEARLIKHILAEENVTALAKIGKGYGEGYGVLSDKMTSFLTVTLQKARDAGMHVVLLAHTHPKPYSPPGQLAYDRHALKLSKHSSSIVQEWADAVLFGDWDLSVDKKDGKGQVRSGTGKTRMLYTDHDPRHDAKNRHGLAPVLPWCWESIAPIVATAPADAQLVPSAAAVAPTIETEHPATAPTATSAPTSANSATQSVLERLDDVLDRTWQEAGERYLIGTGKLAAGQTMKDLPSIKGGADYLQLVIANPAGFKKRVSAWHDAQAAKEDARG